MSDNVKLHPLYSLEYYKLKALFDGDPDFSISPVNDIEHSCTITVKNPNKACILDNYLRFDALKVNIEVKSDVGGEKALARLLDTNPYFSTLAGSDDGLMTAVLMKPECIPVYTDDFFSPSGHTAFTADQLVRDIFGDGFNIQTDFSSLT